MAKKGINIVLISRTESKLDAVKKEIDEKSNVEVKYVVCDYSKFDAKAQATVSSAIKDLDVGILINNVGSVYPFRMYFHDLSDEHINNIINVNITSTTVMTKMVIGGMVDRKRGSIVNIASAAGIMTSPFISEYSAAKGFVEKFSRGLNAEYGSKGISVQSQCPFFVATKIANRRKSITCPGPDEYAAMGLRWIGQSDSVCSPYWAHSLQGYIMSVLPLNVVIRLMVSGVLKREALKEAAKIAKKNE